MTAKDYFEMCKRYWIGHGHNEAESSYRALWWDCKEVWDIDNSWDDEKRNFFESMKRNITEE